MRRRRLAYEKAFLAAARDVGTQVMLKTWALVLWPTLTSQVDAAAMGELFRAPPDRAWLKPSGVLLHAAATYAANPMSDLFVDLVEVYHDQVAPACPSHVELWECCWHWALRLYEATTEAGGFELVDALIDQHRRWAGEQPGAVLAPALALVAGALAAGNRDTAKTHLSSIVAQGVELRVLATVWLTGLSRLLPASDLDEIIVTEYDGTPVSMGTIDDLDDEELRTLAAPTRDLVTAMHRGDQAAADAAEPRVSALSAEMSYRWVWLLAGLVGDRIAQAIA